MPIDNFHVKQKIKAIPFIIFTKLWNHTRNTFLKIFNDTITLTLISQCVFPEMKR